MKSLEDILKCDICREYVAHTMFQPLRCPGLSMMEGRFYVGKVGTDSFEWCDDVVEKNNKKSEAERKKFFEENKQHLIEHGWKDYE